MVFIYKDTPLYIYIYKDVVTGFSVHDLKLFSLLFCHSSILFSFASSTAIGPFARSFFSDCVRNLFKKENYVFVVREGERQRERERGIIKASPSLERCALLYPRITRVFFSFQTFSLLDTHLPSLSFKKPSWNFYRYSPDIFSLFLKHKSNSVKICLFVLKLSFNERKETRYARS